MNYILRLCCLFFLWTNLAFAQADKAIIQNILQENVGEFGLTMSDCQGYLVLSNYIDKKTKLNYITLQQASNDIVLHNALMQIILKPDGKVLKIHSFFSPNFHQQVSANYTGLPAQMEINALKHLENTVYASQQIQINKETRLIALKTESKIEKIFFKLESGEIRTAWKVELQPKKTPDWWNVILNDSNGEVLEKYNYNRSCSHASVNQTSADNAGHVCSDDVNELSQMDASGAYRVFPFPIESPIFGDRALISNPADSDASPFGWHDTNGAPGAEFTITRGNNAFVYEDANDIDLPGYSPNGGNGLNFDYPYNPSNTPLQNRDAALTNLFYWNNFIHDALYANGFDEPNGNFQTNNYGNGGAGNDHVLVEGQDGGGTNNANFATPPDGSNPRMQVYLWYPSMGNFLNILSPEVIAGGYSGSVATFGPEIPEIPITAEIVLVSDASNSPTLGCGALTNGNALQGKIALIDRGECTFVSKVQNAQNAGALAVIIANNVPNGVVQMGGTSSTINIPVIMITQAHGNLIKAQLPGVIAELGGNTLGQVYDCAFDNGVVAHEYGHGVSNRLTGGPQAATCLFNEEQMGEGWSDFFSLVFSHLPAQTANTPRGIGNFVMGAAIDGAGIRPFPYTRDMAVNPHTYIFIREESVPHGVGSVWCAMLWDLYWNMTDLYGFDADIINGNGGNNKAIKLVIEGMKLQACQPGFIDGRDAILLADDILYDGIHTCLIWKTFARRGLGVSASQGSTNSVMDGNQAFDLPEDCDSDNADFAVPFSGACAGDPFTLQDITIPVADSRSWSIPGGIPSTSSVANPSVIFNNPGTYNVTLNVTNALGTSSVTKEVVVKPKPEFTVVSNDSWNGVNGSAVVEIVSAQGNPTIVFNSNPVQTGNVASLPPGPYTVTVTDATGCSTVQSFVVDSKVGLSNIVSDLVKVFPNPSSGIFNISFGDLTFDQLTLEITDIAGRAIYRQSIMERQQTNVDLNSLANGLYFFHFKSSTFDFTKRLVKQTAN